MTLDAPTQRQNQAAEPGNSTWLSANAGSGKTRVLTDRVARLLLDKVPPQNILCLTYTKAAASEMQNRLFRRLGDWAMKRDVDLIDDLSGLGVDIQGQDRLAEARRLFARAIETPGGLRIQTIHSFCASLLRRFPLEAGVSPAFVEMDDRSGALLAEEVVEEMAAGAHRGLIDGIAAHFTGDDLGALIRSVINNREALARKTTEDEIRTWFGLPRGADAADVLATAFDGTEPALAARVASITGVLSKTYAAFGDTLAGLDLKSPDQAVFETLCGLFLYASGDRQHQSKSANFPQSNHTKAVDAMAPVLPELHAFMDRVAAAKQMQLSLAAADKTAALYRFAEVFLPAYEARKQLHGWLDFDDLISRTRDLLSDAAVAGWVLYRLDGGLDHILVDEAQDTSPAQWQVIERLAQEFTSGIGARDGVPRTIFVVGDKKQSIYSFQGADPREFDRMRAEFKARLQDIEIGLNNLELEYSFRSSDAILRFVEAALPDDFGETRHRAFRDALPGRVDLWPVVPPAPKPEKRHWYDPVDIRTEGHHAAVLAGKIADEIAALTGTATIPVADGGRRVVVAGDFLILVRRRSELFEEIIRACKARGLPVAGADRLKLGAELAVKDIAAVLSFLTTPEDSLSLAAALRSPLFGWSEAELYDLAAGREEPYLWQALRRRSADFPGTYEQLRDLRDAAEFLRPYDVIERLLIRHDGRRRLLARLGPEAEDGIDALLSQALSYEQADIPSLTGFLSWLQTDDVEVKRQLDNAGGQIRVMTVHGAKGLESPIVILPDTARRVLQIRDEIIPLAGGGPVWRVSGAQQPRQMAAALAAMKAAQEEEALRLFYVAMTRAETWLIIAAAGDTGTAGDSWYDLAQAGLQKLGAVDLDTPTGPGLRHAHGDWDAGAIIGGGEAGLQAGALPGWAERPAAPPERPVKPRTPSDLGGAKALFGDGSGDEDEALGHGTRVHLLLQHLPRLPRDRWTDAAHGLLEPGLGATDVQRALDEASGVLDDTELGFLFAPDTLSEVEVTAALPGLAGARIAGAIDRLVVAADRVLAVDFKTNAVVPDTPDLTPEGVLRQMGAYAEALQAVYPERTVETAILWTRTRRLMPLPHEIVREALRRTATS